jgi:hypothetical protein
MSYPFFWAAAQRRNGLVGEEEEHAQQRVAGLVIEQELCDIIDAKRSRPM